MAVWTCDCGRIMYPRHCPQCGAMVDADMPVKGEHRHPVPEEDFSVCVFCSAVSVFTEHGLRLPTDEEWKAAMSLPDTQRALDAISYARAQGVIPDARDE